jgi:hypothetical protein
MQTESSKVGMQHVMHLRVVVSHGSEKDLGEWYLFGRQGAVGSLEREGNR